MLNKLYLFAIFAFCGALFVVLSQPVWRGKEMVAEFKSDCDVRGGVWLEHKKMFGTEYACASRLDR